MTKLLHEHRTFLYWLDTPSFEALLVLANNIKFMDMARILLIDDDLAFSSVLHIGLKNKGYEVAVAHDGIEGLKKADEFRPDIIILDVNMPKLSGFDVAIGLKAIHTLKDVPIIMLTSLSQDVNIKRGYSVGVVDYLPKPFNIEHLFIKVKKYLP